jgi:Kef-type K+ transport system membrane component KefB
MGLIILAIVSAIVTAGNISIGALSIIILKAVGFLIGAILIGHFSAPYIGNFSQK